MCVRNRDSRMQSTKLIYAAAWMIFAGAASRAAEVTIVSDVLGPEGPLYVDGNLYYVGWISNTLSRWDGRTTTVLNSVQGCSHNGLALTSRHTLLLACTDNHGAILELDMDGTAMR